MSCIPSIGRRLTRAELREAEKQKFRYSSPPARPSTIMRLNVLAHEANPKLREAVALNYHIPLHLQELLATDPDVGVRCCLARNPQLAWDVLRVLALDESEAVRGFVAVYPSAPEDVLELLSNDESDLVRRLALWRAER